MDDAPLTDTGACVTHPSGAYPLADPVVDVNTGLALAPYSDGKLGVIDTELVQLSLVSVNPISVPCSASTAPRRPLQVTLDHANSTAIVQLSDGCAGLVDLGGLARGMSFFDIFTEIEIPQGYRMNGRPDFDSNSYLAVVPVVSRTAPPTRICSSSICSALHQASPMSRPSRPARSSVSSGRATRVPGGRVKTPA